MPCADSTLCWIAGTGREQVHSIAKTLQLMCPSGELKVWLDSEQLEQVTPEDIVTAVQASDVILVFVSRGFLRSESIRNQLVENAGYSV